MAKINPKVRKITLKPQIDSDVAEEMVNNRKVKLFQTLLKKPKKKWNSSSFIKVILWSMFAAIR